MTKTHVTLVPYMKTKEFIQVDNALITFRNFSGVESDFNRKGDRNFSWVIEDEELANLLIEKGWNVRIRPANEPGDPPFMHLQVKLKFSEDGRGPVIKLVRQGRPNITLTPETVGTIDHMDIERIDMDIRPYDWVLYEGKPTEKRGRTAYLQTLYITQRENRFAERYEYQDDEVPFDVD